MLTKDTNVKYAHISLLFFCISMLYADHDTINVNPPITINPTMNNNNVIKLDIKGTITFIQKSWHTVTTTFKKLWQPQAYKEQATSFLQEHKWTITTLLCFSHYAFLYYHLYKAHSFLSDQTNWAHWQEELTLEELYAIPTEQCEQALLQEIQMRYANSFNPTDFVNPLALFLQQIEKEIACARRAYTLFYWLERYYLARLFPMIAIDAAYAAQSLDRLIYIKRLFLGWMAQYNIAHNKKVTFTL